jgi:predicted SAM-dependent methyltransferase
MTKYYPTDKYYSYHQQIKSSKIRGIAHKLLFWGYQLKLIPATFRYLRTFAALPYIKNVKKMASILDIGCGDGMLIKEMHKWGWKNLTGIDPYIEKDIVYNSGLQVLKQNVFEHSGEYDFIMMNHSMEHIDNQHEVLHRCYKLLNQNGRLLIRIPVSDGYFFRKYGVNWHGIDAPRHFSLHSKKSLVSLAESTGFIVEKIEYDSNIGYFINGEKYCQNITLQEDVKLTAKRKRMLTKYTKILDILHDGGQACFILKKNNFLNI